MHILSNILQNFQYVDFLPSLFWSACWYCSAILYYIMAQKYISVVISTLILSILPFSFLLFSVLTLQNALKHDQVQGYIKPFSSFCTLIIIFSLTYQCWFWIDMVYNNIEAWYLFWVLLTLPSDLSVLLVLWL